MIMFFFLKCFRRQKLKLIEKMVVYVFCDLIVLYTFVSIYYKRYILDTLRSFTDGKLYIMNIFQT